MAATTPPKTGGALGAITKKYGPLPGWAWAGLGVAGFFIYKQRKAAAAAAASSTDSTASPTASLPTSDVTAPSGYGYQGPGVGGGGSGPVPTGATAATNGTTPTVGSPLGTTLPGSTTLSKVPDASTATFLLEQGIPIYIQPGGAGSSYVPAAQYIGGSGPSQYAAPVPAGSQFYYQ